MKKLVVLGLLCPFFALACSGGAGVSADTTTSAAVPGDVVISSPTASTEVGSSISLKSSFSKAVGDASSDDYLAKREALKELIGAADDCSFTLSIPTPDVPDCYGPKLNYNGHIDSDDVDGDTNDDDASDDDGQLPPFDTGIWNSTEGGVEACAAAKMNELVNKISSRADNMIKLFAAMACAGRKAGVELPAAGEEVDLTDAMNEHVVSRVNLLTVESAVVSRLAEDDADGNPVYHSVITSSFNLPGANRTSTVTLTHVPTRADNERYKGLLQLSLVRPGSDGAGCGVGAGSQDAAVISYSKSSASDVRYEVNFGEFCGDADPFAEDETLFTTSHTDDDNGWLSNWHYGLFQLDPESGTGSVAFAWQAGSGDSNTRVFNINTEKDGDDFSGTAYFGYGPAIGDETVDVPRGTIQGMICNWAGPNNDHTPLELAQRQTISKTSGEEVWMSESADILYAPSTTCDAGAADGFTYEAVDTAAAYVAVGSAGGDALDFDNDRTDDTAAISNGLIDLADVDFTRPALPSEI